MIVCAIVEVRACAATTYKQCISKSTEMFPVGIITFCDVAILMNVEAMQHGHGQAIDGHINCHWSAGDSVC